MTEVYFQWQNKVLKESIYPLREFKLQDFLQFFEEFELWEKQNKNLADEDVKKDFRDYSLAKEAEKQIIHREYHQKLMYFKDYGAAKPGKPILPEFEQKLLAKNKDFHKYFFSYDLVFKRNYFLEHSYIDPLEQYQADLRSRVNKLVHRIQEFEAKNPGVDVDPQLMKDHEIAQNTALLVEDQLARLNELSRYHEKIEKDLNTILKIITQQNAAQRMNATEYQALTDHEPQRVMEFLQRRNPDSKPRIEDIVIWKAQQYREKLPKDQEGLLDLIVDKFLESPTKYPLWLQYMVIHFSGMRYQSSHGSWGDPKAILLSLETKFIKDKITGSSAQNTQIAAKKKSIESMSDQQVLLKLEGMKAQLPIWMWKEIVQRTDLKLKYADENWETISEKEKEGYYDRINNDFREILIDWKSKYLTMWREKHAEDLSLVVTRSVCNEVAEHIQHLRGIKPPGGLTAKPLWYRNAEESADPSSNGHSPSFRKIKSDQSLQTGASIFWLRWVDGRPNAWRIAEPLNLKDGDSLLPDELLERNSDQKLRQQKEPLRKGKQVSWVTEIYDNGFRRRKYTAEEAPKTNNSNPTKYIVSQIPEQNWLRWMHEATVAKTGETAEKQVVLTFETALPYDNPLQSSIGVFKRYGSHLRYSASDDRLNGTFVGYQPAGQVPLEKIKVMLDWQKITPWKRIDSSRIRRYWQEVEESLKPKPVELKSTKSKMFDKNHPTRLVEAAPEFEKREKEFITVYQLNPDKRRPGKLSADVAPGIRIRRGLHFKVSKTDIETVNQRTYLRVIECDGVSDAIGKYVQQDLILDLSGEKRTSMPMETKGQAGIRSMYVLNDNQVPIFLPAGMKLVEAAKIRISVVHHQISKFSEGTGMINTDGRNQYYLILTCPSMPAAEGLFIRAEEVQEVTEEAYEAGKHIGEIPEFTDEPVPAKIQAEDKKGAALFKRVTGEHAKFPLFNKVWQTIPEGEQIRIGATEIQKDSKVFYPILYYTDSSLENLYIRQKEVCILPPETIKKIKTNGRTSIQER